MPTGAGFGGCGNGACVYSAKYMVVPVGARRHAAAQVETGVPDSQDFLSVTAMGTPSGVTLLSTAAPVGVEKKGVSASGGIAVAVRGNTLEFALSKASDSREVVVDVRRAGRPCSEALVELL